MTQAGEWATADSPRDSPIDEAKATRQLWAGAFGLLLLLLAEFFLLFQDAGDSFRLGGREGQPLASVLGGKNEFRQKPAGTIIWSSPDHGQAVYRDDAIATLSDSEAYVGFADGSEIVIEPESLVVFEEAPRPDSRQGGRIVARLLRGSIVRRKPGAWPLLVRFSKDAAIAPLRVDDARGGAVFRVIRQAHGFEVVVESGAVTLNESTPVQAGQAAAQGAAGIVVEAARPRLEAPRLKQPKIRIDPPEALPPPSGGPQPTSWWKGVFFREAMADEAPRARPKRGRVRVEFNWDEVHGAKAYRIQIASDEAFTELVREATVRGTRYYFRTGSLEAAQRLWFRVAAIDAGGLIGRFSAVERLQVTRVASEPAPVSAPKPSAGREGIAREPVSPPPAEAVTVAGVSEAAAHPLDLRLFLGYGAVFHSRKFKSSATRPRQSQGSGFVPARIQGELVLSRPGERAFRLGGSALLEKTDLKSGTRVIDSKGIPLLRGWATAELWRGEWVASAGPYAATSHEFLWNGSQVESRAKILAGAILDFMPSAETPNAVHWRIQGGGYFIGATGADVSLSIRQPLREPFQPRRLADHRGAFAEAEAMTRQSSLETSLGGSLSVGWAF